MRLPRYVLAALLTAALFVIFPFQASTIAGLKVAGVKLEAIVSPNEIITHRMIVSLRENDLPMDLGVEVLNLGTYTAKDFITIDNTSFHLEPGKSQEVIATIKIPADIGDGGRYAIISIAQKKPTGAEIGSLLVINVPVRLTVKDSQLTHQGEITELSIGEVQNSKPVNIGVTLKNTGNHHFKFNGEFIISNSEGKILDTIHTALIPSPVIPSLEQKLTAIFISQVDLPLGTYSVKANVFLEDGTILDEAQSSFDIRQSYVPPPAPAKVTLTPGTSSTLKTDNEEINVYFPQGSVISQAEVSVQYYPVEQASSPPSGYSLATTCFRIDGLTGLLTKDATITVKYTDTDLEKAKGDDSKLRLARWDETDDKWTIFDTTIEKDSRTISTKTNRFSIWAVMVSTGDLSDSTTTTTNSTNWGLIIGIVGGLILVIGGILFFRRSKSK
jgi:hypothetical protein